ncbi:MAG TPA: hypothetical protein VFZ48_01795 [Candidatus Saccharimonadales bacterium]
MIEPSQFKFGIVTKLVDGEGEVATDGPSLAFCLKNELSAFELLPYRETYGTRSYELPEVGDVILIVQDNIGTVRWIWPHLVLRSEAGKAILRQHEYTRPVLYSGLYVAYEKFPSNEVAAEVLTTGSLTFPRGALYVGFHLDKVMANFPGIHMEVCRYDVQRSRVVYTGHRKANVFA